MPKERYERYSKIFDKLDISEQASTITEATLRGDVYGDRRFHQKISPLISRSTRLVAHGGDRKSELYRNQAG